MRIGQCANRKGGIMKDKATPQELATAKKEAIDGGMTASVADGIFKDHMSKDMGKGVLYKKYCKKGRK